VVIKLVMRHVMTIADIWTYTRDHQIHVSEGAEQPPYKWYYLGLEQARKDFAKTIEEDSDDPEGRPIFYATRVALRDVNLVHLWDRLWLGTTDLTNRPLQDYVFLHFQMYTRVLETCVLPVKTTREETERVRAAVSDSQLYGWRLREGDAIAMLRPPGYTIVIDFLTIRDTRAHTLHSHWGRRFYGADPPLGFSTDANEIDNYLNSGVDEDDGPIPEHLLRDIYDASALEAYGPCILPSTFSDPAQYDDQPRDQNCTICSMSRCRLPRHRHEDFQGRAPARLCVPAGDGEHEAWQFKHW
jgi:hypothetical protein